MALIMIEVRVWPKDVGDTTFSSELRILAIAMEKMGYLPVIGRRDSRWVLSAKRTTKTRKGAIAEVRNAAPNADAQV